LSEFYKLRRASITDVTALIAFVIGWLGSGIIGWPYIKAGFDAGNPTGGVFRFVVVVFAGGIGCGIVGLIVGWIGGFFWQKYHISRRARVAASAPSASSVTTSAGAAMRASEAPRAALPPLRFATTDIGIDEYIALAARVGPADYDRKRAAAALERTVNIGAWDGDRLVGLARVLSDGYFYAALADVVVDPDFQRKGVGRELMNHAFAKTPRGALLVGAPLTSSAFFDRIGCERGPTGFTMRRAAKPTGISA
jgi:GNAT superfamily N-acetyltransferase